MQPQRKCVKCGETKPESHFNTSSKGPGGLAAQCRACVNAARRSRTKQRSTRHSEDTLLKAAAQRGDIEVVERLLGGATRTTGESLFADAVRAHGSRKNRKLAAFCEYLLTSGLAQADGSCDFGPLVCLAATIGVRDYVELLQCHGAGMSLASAAALGDVAAVRDLLTRDPGGANETDRAHKTALHYCASSAQWRTDSVDAEAFVEIARMLIDAGTPLDARANDYVPGTPLEFAAITGGNVELVRLLLDRGAACTRHEILFSVLRSMARQDDEFALIAELLVQNGMDVNGGHPELSYLHGQARHEDFEATLWLAEHGANIHATLVDGRTPLHVAADRNSGTRVVTLLLDHGADINAVDGIGNTPLFYARQSNKARIVEFLEARGAR